MWVQGQRAKQSNFYFQDEWKRAATSPSTTACDGRSTRPATEAGDRVYLPTRRRWQPGPRHLHARRSLVEELQLGAIGPRLGIAWQPGGSHCTVIRTGYAIAFDPVNTFQVTSVAASVPGQTFTCSNTFSGTNGALITTPGLRLRPRPPARRGIPERAARAHRQAFDLPCSAGAGAGQRAQRSRLRSQPDAAHRAHVEPDRAARGQGRLRSAPDTWDAAARACTVPGTSTRSTQDRSCLVPGHAEEPRPGGGCRADGTWPRLALPGRRAGAHPATGHHQSDLRQFVHHPDRSLANGAGNFASRLEGATLAAGLRPNPQFDQILMIDNGGDSNYHAAQVTFRKRFDKAGCCSTAPTRSASRSTIFPSTRWDQLSAAAYYHQLANSRRWPQLPQRARAQRFRPAPRAQLHRHLRAALRQGQAAVR